MFDVGTAGEGPVGSMVEMRKVAGVTADEESWLLAGCCLPRDHGVRFPDRAAFIAGSLQAFIGDFRPKLP